MYNTNSQLELKTSMLRSSLCDYSYAYILSSGTITITETVPDDTVRQFGERDKGVIFKNCALFTDCISKINNTEISRCCHADV